jgi:DNA-directed RNA polymerase III subunit RPC1
VGGVVQFCYGDDGLDPACLEGDAQPTEFVRTWSHATVRFLVISCVMSIHTCTTQAITSRAGRALLPFEITEITDSELSKPRFQNECTAAYVASILGFITDHIANRLAKVRECRGMYNALEREAEWDEETDLSLGASCTSYRYTSNDDSDDYTG